MNYMNSALSLSKNALFQVRLEIAHWFDGAATREQAVENAAAAIVRHMRQTGQVADDWSQVVIADALFSHGFMGSDTPFWFDCEDELAEEIGERVVEALFEPLPLAA